MYNKTQIAIIGAGINGLSCGALLLEKGYNVTIYAMEFSPDTTSDVAAAIWVPFHCGPAEKVPGWAADTLEYFQQNITKDIDSGCFRERLVTYFKKPEPDPIWASLVELKRVEQSDLPNGFVDGYEFDSLMMDSSEYMPYLVKRFENLGGHFVREKVLDIKDFVEAHPITINCSALGSKELFNDANVFPQRGQVMRVTKTGLKDSICYNVIADELIFIMPRVNDMILGGTAQDNNWSMDIDTDDTARMLHDSGLISSPIDPDSILETKVGLRPCRDEIRLEVESIEQGHVIHNYGHGGGGYTLSWGCAMEVVSLVEGLTQH